MIRLASDDEESQRRKDDLDLECKELATLKGRKEINLASGKLILSVTIMPKDSVKWTGGLRFVGEDQYGHRTAMEALAKHGGEGLHVTPMDLFLSALGGCIGIDLVTMLVARGQVLRSLEIEMDATKREEHPKFFQKISVRIILSGKLQKKVVERSVRLTMEKLCPIAAMLGNVAELDWGFEIVEKA